MCEIVVQSGKGGWRSAGKEMSTCTVRRILLTTNPKDAGYGRGCSALFFCLKGWSRTRQLPCPPGRNDSSKITASASDPRDLQRGSGYEEGVLRDHVWDRRRQRLPQRSSILMA